MPELSKSIPKYRRHKRSGQAVVTLRGKDHYLGPWGSKASRVAYNQLIGEWLSAGRPTGATPTHNDLTVSELVVEYWRFAKRYYVKNGRPTGTAKALKPMLRLLRTAYGRTRAADFGPLQYTNNSYRRAIHRACDLAFPPPSPLAKRDNETAVTWLLRLTPSQLKELKAWQKEHRWSPNQLRHSAATKIRKKYGLEAAQVTLGHANADVSQIYAERDLAKAEQIMREVG